MSALLSDAKAPGMGATSAAVSLGGYGLIVILAVVVAVVYAVAAEIVAWGLNRRRYWAWVAGIVLAGLLVLTGWHNVIHVVMGGLILWGLLDPDSVAAFRRAPQTQSPRADD